MTWALLPLAILWLGFAAVGRRWRIEPRLDPALHASFSDRVVAVVPARNEADELPRTLPSLLRQDHRHLTVILVDDHSTDGTLQAAQQLAEKLGASERLVVLPSRPLEAGWTGKVWAQHQGVEYAKQRGAEWIWFTDADIYHSRDILQRLLATAAGRGRDFVSVMARLRCSTMFEKLLIPAFTYFFAGLYPFAAIGDDASPNGGAAGGCMLVRLGTLERAGGLATIRDAVIDDVALGRACKQSGGRLWLGYAEGVESTRGYTTLGGVWNMVARSAYTQLHYNPLALVACVLGLLYVFWLPMYTLWFASGTRWWLALLTYLAMVRTYLPMVRFLGCKTTWALLLPLSAAFYAGMTITSAWRYHRGGGNSWKGRSYDTGLTTLQR